MFQGCQSLGLQRVTNVNQEDLVPFQYILLTVDLK